MGLASAGVETELMFGSQCVVVLRLVLVGWLRWALERFAFGQKLLIWVRGAGFRH